MEKQKILIGVPPKAHVTLAMDEVNGLADTGFICRTVPYGKNNQSIGALRKLTGVIGNAMRIVKKLYAFSPAYLYLNSRFEPVGSTRDFVSLFLIKLFYVKKLKIIIKSHGSDYTLLCKKQWYAQRIMVPFLQNKVDAWFFLSSDEKKLIENYNSEIGKKIFVTANIIDPSRSVASNQFKTKFNLANKKCNFLFVGRMIDVKGIFYILQAIPLMKYRSEYFFTFVGSGPDLEKAKQKAIEVGVENEVQFTGFIQDDECDHFYANADVLVFPTYDSEGFPMALFKSVAAGLPILTTQIRAAKDYLTEPDNVLWITEQSAESIAAAADKIFTDNTLRSKMTANNRILGKSFSQADVCRQMKQVISSL